MNYERGIVYVDSGEWTPLVVSVLLVALLGYYGGCGSADRGAKRSDPKSKPVTPAPLHHL